MKTFSVFADISSNIITYVNSAENSISVCVAWLTDESILEALVRKAKNGVSIEIITLNGEHNQSSSKFFNQIIACNGKVYLLDKNTQDGILHHKFCVIDREIVITGSYNWSKKARLNEENIVVQIVEDEEDVFNLYDYEREFREIIYKYGIKDKNEENIKSFQALEEQEEIYNTALEFFEEAKDYYTRGKNHEAREFIDEAISLYNKQYLYKDQRLFWLRHLILLNENKYYESAEDLFIYLSLVDHEIEQIDLFKKVYSRFINELLHSEYSYKSFDRINQLTRTNLVFFAQLGIEPHFFKYDEWYPDFF